jgi:hypothetical protein
MCVFGEILVLVGNVVEHKNFSPELGFQYFTKGGVLIRTIKDCCGTDEDFAENTIAGGEILIHYTV